MSPTRFLCASEHNRTFSQTQTPIYYIYFYFSWTWNTQQCAVLPHANEQKWTFLPSAQHSILTKIITFKSDKSHTAHLDHLSRKLWWNQPKLKHLKIKKSDKVRVGGVVPRQGQGGWDDHMLLSRGPTHPESALHDGWVSMSRLCWFLFTRTKLWLWCNTTWVSIAWRLSQHVSPVLVLVHKDKNMTSVGFEPTPERLRP